MLSKRKAILLFLTLPIIFITSSCGKVEKPVGLTVSAASSLKDAMEQIKAEYAKGRTNVAITYNFGSSGSLQQQIEQGAGVDIFVSASEKQMDALSSKGLIIEETRKDLLENEIVLIAPKDSSIVTDFESLTTDKVGKIALGEPKSVPAGQYGEETLQKLNILELIKQKLVYGKDVKEVLTWVETGNADAGIVYKTDSMASGKVKVVAKAPAGTHQPVCYPAAMIETSRNKDAARDFINYLYSSKSKPVFEKYGFGFIAK